MRAERFYHFATYIDDVSDLRAYGGKSLDAQFLIATHSPIILSYPGAVIFSLDGDTIREIAYRESDHYLITRDFLNAPEKYFKHPFDA